MGQAAERLLRDQLQEFPIDVPVASRLWISPGPVGDLEGGPSSSFIGPSTGDEGLPFRGAVGYRV